MKAPPGRTVVFLALVGVLAVASETAALTVSVRRDTTSGLTGDAHSYGVSAIVSGTTTANTPVVVTLTISSRCQLRVVADGNEIIGRTMEQGETLPIELGDELLLLGDNAAAVQFSINGQAGRQLGEPGDVLSARIGRDDYQDFLVRY